MPSKLHGAQQQPTTATNEQNVAVSTNRRENRTEKSKLKRKKMRAQRSLLVFGCVLSKAPTTNIQKERKKNVVAKGGGLLSVALWLISALFL